MTDNGTQFENGELKDFCSKYGIRQHLASVYYRHGNGQAKHINQSIRSNLKKKLEARKGRWAESSIPTGESPFAMSHGVQAVIPTEMGVPTVYTQLVDQDTNDERLVLCADLVEQRIASTMVRLERYHQKIAREYAKRVRPRSFMVGDKVVRQVQLVTKEPNAGKLAESWEGPYTVVEAIGKSSYKLRYDYTGSLHRA